MNHLSYILIVFRKIIPPKIKKTYDNMAIFLLYNFVNSLNASYEMLSEYYMEAYYSLFKSFVFITITLTLFVLSKKNIYNELYILFLPLFMYKIYCLVSD